MMWAFDYLMSFIKQRGAGREHRPLGVIIDELTEGDLTGGFKVAATGTIDVSIRGSFGDGTASGTLTINGQASDFEASGSSGDEGTYRAKDNDYLAAWVIVGDDLRGAVINRNTGDLFSGGNIQPTSGTFEFMGVSLTPLKLTISDY